MRAPRIRHQLFLPVPLSERLEAMAARPGASKSAILADALAAWLNRRAAGELEDRFEQRLSRISATVGRCERNDQVVLETLAVFIRYSLNVNPPLADNDRAGHALGRARFEDFVALVGLTAGGGTMTAADLLKPGKLAGTGFEAAWPLLDQVSKLLGPVSFFTNFMTIVVLLVAWLVVIVAFFVLAVQLFITILEFKLTSLAGFVLVPFALWNRTSFLAERVLGNVVSSGIKVMVLAVIVGIGSGFFSEFTGALQGQEPDIGQAMSLVLASLALFGLGIFGPSIASGLVAGAPQLGAGAAIGTAGAVAGGMVLGGGAAAAAARGIGGGALGAVRAGAAMGSAASTSYKLGQETAGSASVGAGLGGMASAAKGAIGQKVSAALGTGEAAETGRNAAWAGSGSSPSGAHGAADGTPQWAQRLRAEQSARHHRHATIQALREGDRGGAGAHPDIKERDD